MIGFHVTSTRNRDSIAASGLLTTHMGWNTGYVWFFLDPEQAERSAHTGAWGGDRGDNDIWQLDLDGLDIIDDPHQAWGEDRSNRAVPHNIGPDRVTLVR